jgi:hypothetical protein
MSVFIAVTSGLIGSAVRMALFPKGAPSARDSTGMMASI